MVFSSILFVYLFLPIVLIIYYISPLKVKNLILLMASLFFYAWGEITYMWVMLVSIFADYLAGLLMERFSGRRKIQTGLLIGALVVNVGLLLVFKYSSFFITQLNGLGLSIPDPELPLPIGISFFTFQTMSYIIDLYMGKIKVQKNPISFAAYVTMFPQLIAGPIVRYADVENDIDDRTINVDKLSSGIGQFIRGLAKKVLLANSIGAVWTTVKAMDYGEISVLTAWIGILAFTFQIFYDFAGYSDMACGMGRMLGFEFPENFNFPYLAKSISDFWRRWHMTLGNWFKSYVYFPLGGSRVKTWKIIRNTLIVWMLTGFWHGANWNFILWGLYFGVLILGERFVWGKLLVKLPVPVQVVYSFLLVVFGWVMFEMESLSQIGAYLGAMFGLSGAGFADSQGFYFLMSNLALFLLCFFFAGDYAKRIGKKFAEKLPGVHGGLNTAALVAVLLLCTAYLVNTTYNPFLYFRF